MRDDEALLSAIDRLDNAIAMLTSPIPLPASVHVDALRGVLPSIAADLRKAAGAEDDS